MSWSKLVQGVQAYWTLRVPGLIRDKRSSLYYKIDGDKDRDLTPGDLFNKLPLVVEDSNGGAEVVRGDVEPAVRGVHGHLESLL